MRETLATKDRLLVFSKPDLADQRAVTVRRRRGPVTATTAATAACAPGPRLTGSLHPLPRTRQRLRNLCHKAGQPAYFANLSDARQAKRVRGACAGLVAPAALTIPFPRPGADRADRARAVGRHAAAVPVRGVRVRGDGDAQRGQVDTGERRAPACDAHGKREAKCAAAQQGPWRSAAHNAGRRPAGGVAKVGARAGVTRSVAPVQVAEQPPIYMVDSPGIMVPNFAEEPELGFKLALLGTPTAAANPAALQGQGPGPDQRAHCPMQGPCRTSACRRRTCATTCCTR